MEITSSIKKKFRTVFLLSAIGPLVIAFFYGMYTFSYALKAEMSKGILEEVVLRANKIESDLQLANSDIQFLSQLPSLKALLEVEDQNSAEYREHRVRLEEEFIAFA